MIGLIINLAHLNIAFRELENHPWFVGVQFHPELKSRAANAHPLFREFVKAAVWYKNK